MLCWLGVSGLVERRPGGAAGGRLDGSLSAMGAALAAGFLLTGQAAVIPFPVGTLGISLTVALDRLGASFLLLLFLLAGAAVLLAGPEERRGLRSAVAVVGGAIVSGDGGLLAAMIVLAAVALRPAVGGAPSAATLVAACGLLALAIGTVPGSGILSFGGGFAALRDRTTAAGAAAPVSALVLLGIALAGTAGVGRTRVRSGSGRTLSLVPAVLLGQFALLRIVPDLGAALFDFAATGIVLFAGGMAALALLSARAIRAEDLAGAVRLLVLAPGGGVVGAAGVALAARGMDLSTIAAAAAAAALVLGGTQVLAGASVLLMSSRIAAENGGTDLRRLGGAARSMPRAVLVAGIGACFLGWVPGLPGYGGMWTLLDAALGVARVSGRAWMLGAVAFGMLCGVLGAVAGAIAWLRLFGLVALGRPRTPRAAAALDIAAGEARGHGVLLLPALLLGFAAGPLQRLAVMPGWAGRAESGGLVAASAMGGAGYGALPLLLVIGGMVLVVGRVAVRRGGQVRYGAAWNAGMPDDPPWLPFGDPLLQPGPRTLPAMLGSALASGSAGPGPARRVGTGIRDWVGPSRRWRRGARRLAATAIAAGRDRPGGWAAWVALLVSLGWWLFGG
ncbi:MAG: hypothetical protein INR65_05675 [Gluconacetobacter diazotrophicus]|nr:hypothetical protein [Gluconacetobacter diazotrophicus]